MKSVHFLCFTVVASLKDFKHSLSTFPTSIFLVSGVEGNTLNNIWYRFRYGKKVEYILK